MINYWLILILKTIWHRRKHTQIHRRQLRNCRLTKTFSITYQNPEQCQKHGGRWFRPITCLLRNLRSDELEYDTRDRIAWDAASLRQRGACARLCRALAMSPLKSCHVRPQIFFFHTGLSKLKTPSVRILSETMRISPVFQARTAPRNELVPISGGCRPFPIWT